MGALRLYILAGVLGLCSHIVAASQTYNEETQQDITYMETAPVHMKGEATTATVKCRIDLPIRHCQFSWYYKEGDFPPVRPLASLSDTTTNASLSEYPSPALPEGTGWWTNLPGLNSSIRFIRGGCELALSYERFSDTVVGCRVGDRWGDWTYGIADLYSNERGLLPVDVNARELILFPGHDADILHCNTSMSLENCRVSTPHHDDWLDMDRGPASLHSVGRYRYHGAGVEHGECGLTVINVTANDHGLYSCLLTTETIRAIRTVKVIVANPPPSPPVIRLDYLPTDSGRPQVRATCTYEAGSIPEPKVGWLLDADDVWPYGDDEDAVDDNFNVMGGNWTWPGMTLGHAETLMIENLDLDVGRKLRCFLSHVALETPLWSQPLEISLDYPPFDTDFTIHYEKGITLKATCKTGVSRPVSNITWLLGDRVVRQDAVNDADNGDGDASNGTSISQTLHVKLKPQDDARMFRCVVTHPALAQPIEKAERVWYKPFDPLVMGPRPDEVFVRPGHDVNISCMANNNKYHAQLDTCSFKLFGRRETAYFHPGDRRGGIRSGYHYNGDPLEYGGCGMTLQNATEEDNGRVLCRMEAETTIVYRRYVTVIVAHPPTPPVLRVKYDGDVIKASCSVGAARPMVDLAWMLNWDTIRQDASDDSPLHLSDVDVIDDYGDDVIEDGAYSHTLNSCRSPLVKMALTQTIAWRLEPEDNGKKLRCVITHPLLRAPLEDVHEIVF